MKNERERQTPVGTGTLVDAGPSLDNGQCAGTRQRRPDPSFIPARHHHERARHPAACGNVGLRHQLGG